MGFGNPVAASVQLPPTSDGQPITLQQVVDSTYNPVSVAGLQVFLDSAYGHAADEGEAIAAITERSPNGRVFAQPTLADRPVLSTLAEGIGNVRVLKVTADNQFMSTTAADATLGMGTDGLTIVSVVKTSATGNNDGRGIAGCWVNNAVWTFLARFPYQASELENYGSVGMSKTDTSLVSAPLGKIADGQWHVLAQVIDRPGELVQAVQDGAGFSQSGTGALASGAPGTLYLFRYHTGPSSGVGNCYLRFFFVFNRKLPYDELSQLVSWVNREIGRTGDQKHTKILVGATQDHLYVRTDGNDTNIGTADTSGSAIQTLAQLCQRFDDTPYMPSAVKVADYPVGDGTFITRKVAHIGPGLFEAPMFANMHATMIVGTVAEVETRTITVLTYAGGVNGTTKFTVGGAALANDAWVNKHLRLNGSDYYRLIVSKNVGNVIECTTDRAWEVIQAGDTVTVLDFQTEIRFPDTRYHAVANCWELQFYNCKLSVIETNTDGGFINVVNGSYVWFVNCWIDNLGVVARHSKVLMRRTSFVPNYGPTAANGFWPVSRQFGRVTFEGVFVWAKYASQFRFEIQDSSHWKVIAINAMRGVQGIRVTCAQVSGSYDGTSLTLYDTQYGIWLMNSASGALPPIVRDNVLQDSGYGNWDIRCSLNSRVTILPTGGQTTYTTTVDPSLPAAVAGAVSPDGSLIYCSDPTRVPYGPQMWTALTLLNGWADEGSGAYATPAYERDAAGRVALRGAAKDGTPGLALATLPLGTRPGKTLVFVVSTSTGFGQVTVAASGDVTVTVTDGGTVFLDSVTWVP